jgi:diguanylate cyclase (GGDEF)-like protein
MMLGACEPGWNAALPRATVKVLLAAGSTLAMLALGLAIVSLFVTPSGQHVTVAAIACAASGLILLREGAGLERRRSVELGLIDAETGLYNLRGLRSAGDAMLHEARHGRPVSVVVLDMDDLLEACDLYGADVGRRLLARVVRKVRAIAGGRGVAARSGGSQFTVVLPGMDRDRAMACVQRVLGHPSRIEFDAGRDEIVLVPEILCAAAVPGTRSIADVQHAVSDELAVQRAREQRRRLWLQRERERHSRPMSLPPSQI